MSAGEVERLVSELSGGTGGDEEEEWLYGDENEVERPEEENASANPPSGIEDETAENGISKPKVTETEDDSESDSDDDEDDVHVTIGDIKTGAPQYGSYGTAPVNLNIKTGGRVYGAAGTKVKGVDLDAPGSINGVPLLEVDLDSFEDKPWRKPGADLSDYFNYGFNEDTWKAYCEKQKRIRMGLELIPNKITAEDYTMEVTPGAEIQDGRYNLFKVQQGRTGNAEKETVLQSAKAEFTSPPSLFKTGLPPSRNSASSQSQTSSASRKANSGIGKWQDRYGRAESPDLRRLSGTIDVIGQTITISRVEGRRRANENSNIQVLSERSAAEVDNNFSKPPPFFPPGAPPTHLPPPPFLPPPPTVSTAPPLIPPPGFPPPPGAPPPSLIPTIESGHSSGYDSRSARAFPYGNVAFPHLPGSAPSWPSLVDTTKQWDYYARREKDRERERERDRERDRDRDRERERTRERERERDHSPTPSVFNSDEERYRYREYTERGYERHRASREKEERHRERRHREKEETRHKSSRSNSRRRHESEEGDSHRRHKHKKSKRSKEGKEAGSEPAPEQESTEAAPAE
ncbi:pre-mRNA 3'-end-processing factor FIP1 isoform X2 [Phascolarctos cinereus]|uniref:Pre-mRNA 3'-end-processing factor FIP1 n=1 Tax=Phascolarctos cinereus TaxID=38626 RepID=A0A6P5KL25_PHACI|nr:pre-mRNA 3'-end-processing factor FIP1 isoform X2 [Monodelphis domestica]XP_020845669.1 pre-mRNA 3'-end-processing factor FIP1 isoform X2 [Phascolarctos cinereus]